MRNSTPYKNRAVHILACSGISAIFITGCATAPNAEIAVSRAAVADAIAAGGNQEAPLELASAQDKLTTAESAMESRDYGTARTLAMQAETDAKLAESKANAAKAEKAAEVVQTDVRVLREELARIPQ